MTNESLTGWKCMGSLTLPLYRDLFDIHNEPLSKMYGLGGHEVPIPKLTNRHWGQLQDAWCIPVSGNQLMQTVIGLRTFRCTTQFLLGFAGLMHNSQQFFQAPNVSSRHSIAPSFDFLKSWTSYYDIEQQRISLPNSLAYETWLLSIQKTHNLKCSATEAQKDGNLGDVQLLSIARKRCRRYRIAAIIYALASPIRCAKST